MKRGDLNDIHGAQMISAVMSLWNRLAGEWYWEDDLMGVITPEFLDYAIDHRRSPDE